jgi:hypothetical protein
MPPESIANTAMTEPPVTGATTEVGASVIAAPRAPSHVQPDQELPLYQAVHTLPFGSFATTLKFEPFTLTMDGSLASPPLALLQPDQNMVGGMPVIAAEVEETGDSGAAVPHARRARPVAPSRAARR